MNITMQEDMESLYQWFPLVVAFIFCVGIAVGLHIAHIVRKGKVK